MQRQTFLAWPAGQKVKYHLISITKSIAKIFIPNFVCVLTNKRYKTYQTGFSFCPLGHAPGVGLWGTRGTQGVSQFFFKHGHVAYQIDGDDEQNKMLKLFHPRVNFGKTLHGQNQQINCAPSSVHSYMTRRCFFVCLVWFFTSQSTAMVMSVWSVHLTTLFLLGKLD